MRPVHQELWGWTWRILENLFDEDKSSVSEMTNQNFGLGNSGCIDVVKGKALDRRRTGHLSTRWNHCLKRHSLRFMAWTPSRNWWCVNLMRSEQCKTVIPSFWILLLTIWQVWWERKVNRTKGSERSRITLRQDRSAAFASISPHSVHSLREWELRWKSLRSMWTLDGKFGPQSRPSSDCLLDFCKPLCGWTKAC